VVNGRFERFERRGWIDDSELRELKSEGRRWKGIVIVIVIVIVVVAYSEVSNPLLPLF
jgi:hypothetical protein